MNIGLKQYIEYLQQWLKEKVTAANANGLIVGLSGGIDSAVVAGLIKAAFPDNSLCVIMPCHSNPIDATDARLVATALQLETIEIDLSSTFDDLFTNKINAAVANRLTDTKGFDLASGNTKARLRMTTLYALSQSHNYLVVGTDNAAEWYTGYFTKYGDGGVDLVPIIHLSKGEVKEAAKLLNIPSKIIDRVPSAGLYENQTDEEELGLTYNEIDKFMLTGMASEKNIAKLELIHSRSEHKRNLPLAPQTIIR